MTRPVRMPEHLKEKNDRRFELINIRAKRDLTELEKEEFERLTIEISAWVDKVCP